MTIVHSTAQKQTTTNAATTNGLVLTSQCVARGGGAGQFDVSGMIPYMTKAHLYPAGEAEEEDFHQPGIHGLQAGNEEEDADVRNHSDSDLAFSDFEM